MNRDFVSVKIDVDRMELGKEVGLGLRAGHDGGIPWFLFVDPSQSLLRVKPAAIDDAAEALSELGYLADSSEGAENPVPLVLQRRKVAVLATADGPQGNVGCPMSKAERSHFIGMLKSANLSFTEEELQLLADELHAYAREVVGERADQ